MDPEIRKAFWKSLADSPFLMVRLTNGGDAGQPMTAMLDKDAHGTIWFFMNKSNRLAPGGPAQADLSAKGHKLFAALSGTLMPETDHAVFDKLWSDKVGAWFEGGKDSPSLLLMRFEIADAEVWQVDMTVSGLLHLFTGSLIQPEEAGHHAEGAV
jgi:general stress protein 26